MRSIFVQPLGSTCDADGRNSSRLRSSQARRGSTLLDTSIGLVQWRCRRRWLLLLLLPALGAGFGVDNSREQPKRIDRRLRL